MAAKQRLLCLLPSGQVVSTRNVVLRRIPCTVPTRKYYHSSPPWQQDVSAQQSQMPNGPNIEGMKASPAIPETARTIQEDNTRNAAFLGEADSDDGFEADVEANPRAHRHEFGDVTASGLHGQSGEGDEPLELPRRPQEALDSSNSAYLGEADSDDAYEVDREVNPATYRHNIVDSSKAAYLGEADSDDAYEADREANPEAYRHKIAHTGASGLHGGPGEGDENIPRGPAGRRFV